MIRGITSPIKSWSAKKDGERESHKDYDDA
jgi:hypothetical protein